MIPYARHSIDARDIAAVTAALSSSAITQGTRVQYFENLLAYYVRQDAAVAVSSGTAALHAALSTLPLQGKRKKVITSPLTFVATANAIKYCGLEPVFADVRRDTLNLDANSVARLIDRETSAVLSVDYAGQPADMAELRAVCQSHDLMLVSDSCHSLGASYRNQSVGSIADLTVFSFHAVKTITTAEGGAVTGKLAPLMAWIRRFRNHGRNEQGTMIQPGYNYRLSELHAALGISQLEKANQFLAAREQIAERYYTGLAGIRNLELPVQLNDRTSSWHLFVVRVPAERRDKFRSELSTYGIGTQIHYRLVTEHLTFRGYHDPSIYPVAVREAARLVSIPMFAGLSQQETSVVISVIRDVARRVL